MGLRRSLLSLLVFFGLATLAPAAAVAGSNACTSSIVEAESKHNIPPGLLQAMALLESGLNGQPYPWALNLSGQVIYASNLDAAQKLLGARQAAGRKNLYAGCLQLSVRHHRGAFGSLGEMLTPHRNVSYAAKYLAGHFEDYGDWQAAVRRYNGGKPKQSAAYFCRVLRILSDIRPETAREIDTGTCGTAAAPAPDLARSQPIPEDLHEDLRS